MKNVSDSMKVTIDGVEYVRADRDLVDYAEAMRLLGEVYGSLWTEAYYDAYNDSTKKFATPLHEKMARANEILRFKT
jgi:hypothetical protein